MVAETPTARVSVESDGSLVLNPSGSSTQLEIVASSIGFRHNRRWLQPGSGLELQSISSEGLRGVDNLGAYRQVGVTWQSSEAAGDGTRVRFQTNVRVYEHEPAIALEQVFMDGANQTAVDDDDEDKVGQLLVGGWGQRSSMGLLLLLLLITSSAGVVALRTPLPSLGPDSLVLMIVGFGSGDLVVPRVRHQVGLLPRQGLPQLRLQHVSIKLCRREGITQPMLHGAGRQGVQPARRL